MINRLIQRPFRWNARPYGWHWLQMVRYQGDSRRAHPTSCRSPPMLTT